MGGRHGGTKARRHEGERSGCCFVNASRFTWVVRGWASVPTFGSLLGRGLPRAEATSRGERSIPSWDRSCSDADFESRLGREYGIGPAWSGSGNVSASDRGDPVLGGHSSVRSRAQTAPVLIAVLEWTPSGYAAIRPINAEQALPAVGGAPPS